MTFYLHAVGGNKLKAILPSGQKHQSSWAPHSMQKDSPKKAAWVESRHAWLLRMAWAAPSERLAQYYPKFRSSTEIPRGAVSKMPSFSWLLSLPLCALWAGGASKTPPTLLGSGLLLTPMGFRSSPCSKSGADIFKLRGGTAGILSWLPKNCCKKCTNKIFIKWAASLFYFQIALRRKRFIGDRKQY